MQNQDMEIEVKGVEDVEGMEVSVDPNQDYQMSFHFHFEEDSDLYMPRIQEN